MCCTVSWAENGGGGGDMRKKALIALNRGREGWTVVGTREGMREGTGDCGGRTDGRGGREGSPARVGGGPP